MQYFKRTLLNNIIIIFLFTTDVTQAQTHEEDLHQRYREINWPSTHQPENAELFAHNTILINAPCKNVWALLIAAREWPTWYSNAANVELNKINKNTLSKNISFTWHTFGFDVKSQVLEYKPYSRLGWSGKTADIDAYHAWYLRAANRQCEVITEEVVKGNGGIALRKNNPEAMHKGHDLWLRQLKDKAEQKTAMFKTT